MFNLLNPWLIETGTYFAPTIYRSFPKESAYKEFRPMAGRKRHGYTRYPAQTQLIKQLVSESTEFESLCEDYGEGGEALNGLTL